MKKNIKQVKKFQKPLICLIGILLLVVGFVIGKITDANADDVSYDYSSSEIGYDSTNNNLNATNVKDAIDELYGKVGQCPTGQFCYSSDEIRSISGGNFLRAYVYDENSCVTGNESGCVKTNCYLNGTCLVGTIIDYFVNNATVVRFHVLHDDGDTITMQSQKNTVYNTAWYSGEKDTSKGPTTIISALKTATDNWTNVNSIDITSTTTNFIGVNSIDNSCTHDSVGKIICSGNLYNIGNIAGTYRARMITIQEAVDSNIGQCKTYVNENMKNVKSCRMFMNNFLYTSDNSENCRNIALCIEDDNTENGGAHNWGYWTMGGYGSEESWRVSLEGYLSHYGTSNSSRGARAVVVVNK